MGQIVYRGNGFKQAMSVLFYALIICFFIYHLGLLIVSGFNLERVSHMEWFNEHFDMFGTSGFTVTSLVGLVIWSGVAVPIIIFSVFLSGLLINSLFFPSTFDDVRLFSKEALSDKYCSDCNKKLSGLSVSCPHCKANFIEKS